MTKDELTKLMIEWDDTRKAIAVHQQAHSKVFEVDNQLRRELLELSEQIKTGARDHELAPGQRTVDFLFDIKGTRKLATRTMKPSVLSERSAELIAVGLLKPPSYSAVNKAVTAGKLPPSILEYAEPLKSEKDLTPGKDYTVTVKFPDAVGG